MLGALLATVMPCCALVGAGRGATGDDKVHAAAQVSFQARLFSLDGDRCSH